MDIILTMKTLVIADIMLVFNTQSHIIQLDLCVILNTIVVVTETELLDGD